MSHGRSDLDVRVLFFGAGAIGTLFAAKLGATGNDVSVLARGARLASLREEGLRIRARTKTTVETFAPKVVSRVAHDLPYDLVIVLVRRAQVDEALEAIAAEHAGDVLVMVNDARGYDTWRSILGPRLFVGFAGAVGVFDAHGVLVYDVAPGALQPTVVGEPDGRVTRRVLRARTMLREAGFPVQIRTDMAAWQRTHAAWITPFMLAATIAARDAGSLTTAEYARAWVGATQEALAAVRASGTKLAPATFGALLVVPSGLLVAVLWVALRARSLREQVIASGAASSAEGVALVDDLGALAGHALPNLEALAARAVASGAGPA